MSELNYVTEDSFSEQVLNAAQPVLVDFTATWCGPCKMVDPIVKQLADEWGAKAKVVKIDADQNPNVLARYGVMGLPTLMLFVGGEMRERVSGYQPKDKLNARFLGHFK
jgi:thioredoxin 1